MRELFHNKYTGFGLLAVLLWSTTVALARSISEQIGPVSAGASVYLTGGLMSFIYLFYAKKDSFRKADFPIRYFISTGTLFLVYTVCLFLAIGLANSRMEAIELGLVNYLWPGLTILLSLILLSRKASLWIIPGTILAFMGIFLVLTTGTDFNWLGFINHVAGNPYAYVCGLVAAVSWALYSNLTRLWKSVDESAFVPFYILLTGIFLLLLTFVFPEEHVLSGRLVFEILCLSLSTVSAYVLWEKSMQKGDLALVLPFSYLTPLFSTIVSATYLGIFPDTRLWLGCLILIAGSFLSWKSLK
jgi:drug/metabolite transporter (DMT)-like permease